MNTSKRLAACGLTLIFLVGCQTAAIQSNVTPAELKDKGIVILSASHDLGANDSAQAIFYIRGTVQSDRHDFESSAKIGLNFALASDYQDRKGRLHVIELPPDTYKLYAWQVVNATTRFSYPIAPIEFQVTKGRAVYLGNLHARLSLSKPNWLGGIDVLGAAPAVIDRSEQDLALAAQRVPALAGRTELSLLPSGPLQQTGAAVFSGGPVPVFVPKAK